MQRRFQSTFTDTKAHPHTHTVCVCVRANSSRLVVDQAATATPPAKPAQSLHTAQNKSQEGMLDVCMSSSQLDLVSFGCFDFFKFDSTAYGRFWDLVWAEAQQTEGEHITSTVRIRRPENSPEKHTQQQPKAPFEEKKGTRLKAASINISHKSYIYHVACGLCSLIFPSSGFQSQECYLVTSIAAQIAGAKT